MSQESLWFLRNSTALCPALTRTLKFHLFHGCSVLQLSLYHLSIYLSMTMAQQWSQKVLIFSVFLSFQISLQNLPIVCSQVVVLGLKRGVGHAWDSFCPIDFLSLFYRFHQKVFTWLVPVDNDSLCQLLQNGSGMPQGFPVSCTCLSLQWLPQFVPHGYDGLTLLDSPMDANGEITEQTQLLAKPLSTPSTPPHTYTWCFSVYLHVAGENVEIISIRCLSSLKSIGTWWQSKSGCEMNIK